VHGRARRRAAHGSVGLVHLRARRRGRLRGRGDGARERFGADVGAGVTGIAGPGGGSPEKPVGLVCFCVVADGARLARSATLPGGRADVRDRATTVTMHLLRRLLRGESDLPGA
jgi:hypothetical protein